MENISGKKIFLLYPDESLRAVFYGELRNSFTVYYLYDYEKIRPLSAVYPGSIVVLNLIANDLAWLPEELEDELKGLGEEEAPSIIVLHDGEQPPCSVCSSFISYSGDDDALKSGLRMVFEELGGKGRRNFVRYGGNGEDIASIILEVNGVSVQGVVHDISASGLSCSFSAAADIPNNKDIRVTLGLGGESLEIDVFKILERKFNDDIIHIMKFREGMDAGETEKLFNFIYSSLDAEMNLFVKKLSK